MYDLYRFAATRVAATNERARETRYVRMNRSRLKGQLGSDEAEAATAVLFQVSRPFPRRISGAPPHQAVVAQSCPPDGMHMARHDGQCPTRHPQCECGYPHTQYQMCVSTLGCVVEWARPLCGANGRRQSCSRESWRREMGGQWTLLQGLSAAKHPAVSHT